MFYIDENIRNVANPGHAARFVSIFTHFGKVSIKDAEDHVANITWEKQQQNTKQNATKTKSIGLGLVSIPSRILVA